MQVKRKGEDFAYPTSQNLGGKARLSLNSIHAGGQSHDPTEPDIS
jgi:hypothetical protein